MPICPKNRNYCIDDICYAGICVRTGDEPLEKCNGCGSLIEKSEGDYCESCRYEEMDYDEEDYWS